MDTLDQTISIHNQKVFQSQYEQTESGFFQRKERFVHSLFLSDSDIKYLSSKLPNVAFVPRGRYDTRSGACELCSVSKRKCTCLTSLHIGGASQHPRLYLDRDYAEQVAYDFIQYHCSMRLARGRVVDIGGNARRHASYGRDIHVCCPVSSPHDVAKLYLFPDGYNSCRHMVEHCDCVAPSAYLSVDTLYHLSPVQVARLVAKSGIRLLVAVVHEFPEAYGAFGGGEATYMYISPSRVRMDVRGNIHPYIHDSLSWMRQSHYPTVFGSLVWSRVATTADHSVYFFTLSEHTFPVEVYSPSPFQASLGDSKLYGQVLVGPLADAKPSVSIFGEMVSAARTKLFSIGSWCMLHKTRDQFFLCPKGLVSDLRVHLANRDRSKPFNLAQAISMARHCAKRMNIPSEILADSLHLACCLAYVADMQTEIENFHAIVEPVSHLLPIHRDATEFRFKRVWTAFKTACLAAGATVVSSLPAIVSTIVQSPLPAVSVLAPCLFGAATISAALLALFHAKKARMIARRLSEHPVHPTVEEVRMIDITVMSGKDPTMPLDQVLLQPMDETAQIQVPMPEARTESSTICAFGLVSEYNVPVCASSSAHSNASALVQRQLKPQAIRRPEVREENEAFRLWFRKNCSVLIPDLVLHRMSPNAFEEAISAFPDYKKQKLRKAREEYFTSNVERKKFLARQCFQKTETQCKNTTDDWIEAEFAPRCIQGASDHFNAVVSPFVKSFTKHVKSVLHLHRRRGAVYASGFTDAVAFGTHLHDVFESYSKCVVVETDFSKFDTCINEILLECENELFFKANCPEDVFLCLQAAIETVGRAKFGIKYKVRGTRRSGDPQTSVGNSVLQLALLYYALCCATGASLETLLERSTIFAQGDDGLTFLSEEFSHCLPAVREILQRLGFEVKMKVHSGPDALYQATFLSSRVYPVQDALTGQEFHVLAPMIGRQVEKFGYYTCPPPGVPHLSIVRGDAIGRQNIYRAIPFLRCYITRTLELTSQGPAYRDPRKKEVVADTDYLLAPSAATYGVIERVYGLTKLDEENLENLLKLADHLPMVVNFPPLHQAAVVDGVVSDVGPVLDRYDAEYLEDEPGVFDHNDVNGFYGKYLPAPVHSVWRKKPIVQAPCDDAHVSVVDHQHVPDREIIGDPTKSEKLPDDDEKKH